jgi:hypothetical protein
MRTWPESSSPAASWLALKIHGITQKKGDCQGNDLFASSAQANAKRLMDVDLRFVLQFNGNGKTLMRNLLPGPSPFCKYREIVELTHGREVNE